MLHIYIYIYIYIYILGKKTKRLRYIYISTYSSVRFPRLENRLDGRLLRLLLINCL